MIAAEQRIRLHAEVNLSSASDIAKPYDTFLRWAKALLKPDKFFTWATLLRYPFPTAAIADDVFRELAKVLRSRNASASYYFNSQQLHDDWLAYRTKINSARVWRIEGMDMLQTMPHAIMVVDLPVNQDSLYPEPYFYFLDITNLYDFESTDRATFEYILIHQGDYKLLYIDKTRYITISDYTKPDEAQYEQYEHNLGFCPARFFWSDTIKRDSYIRKSPIVKQLDNLDWYLFFAISKRHLDLYAPYPIYSAYKADCDYENTETNETCDGGLLRNAEGNYIIDRATGEVKICPACGPKRIVGPGSFIEVPIPSPGETADLKNPVSITSVDIDSLKYNTEEIARLKNEIILSCVGSNGMVSEKEAVNVQQIAANFENKSAVLNVLKLNFEKAQTFLEDTLCKLRYGNDYLGSSISYGTEFYVYTVDDLYNKYSVAKKNGASSAELDQLMTQIIETEYIDSPEVMQRLLLMKYIEPFRHLSFDEVMKIAEKQIINPAEFNKLVYIKFNFSSLIDRFERENTDITKFANNKTLNEKIKIITKQLEDYATEIIGRAPAVKS